MALGAGAVDGRGGTVTGLQRAHRDDRGGGRVTWETPAFEEIKMDMEVTAYQADDFDEPYGDQP